MENREQLQFLKQIIKLKKRKTNILKNLKLVNKELKINEDDLLQKSIDQKQQKRKLNKCRKIQKQVKWIQKVLRMNQKQVIRMSNRALFLSKSVRIIAKSVIFSKFLKCINQVLAFYPNNAKLLLKKAQVLQAHSKYKESIYWLKQVFYIDRHDSQAQQIKIEILQGMSSKQNERFCKNIPRNLLFSTFDVLSQLEREKALILLADRILTIYPNNFEVLVAKSKALHSIVEFEEAILCMHKVITNYNFDQLVAWYYSSLLELNLYKGAEFIKDQF